MLSEKNVTILLSTYNGAEFIKEQIDSLLLQQNVNVNIFVRDDGSTDKTLDIIKKYQTHYCINVIKGKNIGWRKSFMELIYNSPESDYYAFCDQDDIWLPDKLKVAIEKLQTMPQNQPNLYCSNLRYYRNGRDLGLVKKKNPQLTLQLSLMRSLTAGCTMVFNKELRDLISCYRPEKISAHDFWTYQVASLLGDVYFDMNSYILYRQHDNNQIGASISNIDIWKKRFDSAKKNFYNNDRQFAAKELLRLYRNRISIDKRNVVERVAFYDKNIRSRLKFFLDMSFTMGSLVNDIWLRVRILFGKI